MVVLLRRGANWIWLGCSDMGEVGVGWVILQWIAEGG